MKRFKVPSLGFFAILGLFLSPWIFTHNAGAVAGGPLTGKVIFEGTAPPPQILKVEADPVCLLQHQDGMTSEEVVVNPNGTLKNVFVYVKQGLEGQTFPAPATPVVFDQKGCHYEPHVFGIQVGQPLEILNSDDTLHNVHALPKASQEFNLGMPIKGMKLTKAFTAPEVAVKIKCEVHPWMAAYAGVLDHPFYAVTGEDGSFSLKDLPPGEYVVEAWHEKYGTQTQTVKVPETSEISFTFKAS
ncbi:MAG: carboxypeptidase regulatory-like domain-containing protein [Candidatus Omnitrophica bacterium]|nr:carboxypeptidase regulatory-like domain-containing protein [Candidatus Omnitrophota bacterium]